MADEIAQHLESLHAGFGVEQKSETVSTPTPALPGLSDPSQATLNAARESVGQPIELNRHGKPKGKPGRPITSGKWAKKNKVPVGQMGDRSDPVFVDAPNDRPTDQTESFQTDFEPPPKPFDREGAKVYAEGIIDLFKEIRAEVARSGIKRKTKDDDFANLIADNLEIREVPKNLMNTGLVGMAEKYNVDLARTPEGALIGGFALWLFQTRSAIREAVDKYLKEHPQTQS